MKKTIAKGMESPITGGAVFLVEDVETHEFRKEKYEVHARYYVCKDTGEKFTSEEQDELLLNELYNQYRVKHGLPFPDEIKAIRERYGLNYTQVTKIVGFGQNQWRHYENGDVPSESNGRTIVALRSKASALALLESCKNEFDASEYEKVRSQILSSSEQKDDEAKRFLFFGRQTRDCWNGYSELSASKTEDMVRFFVGNGIMFKTKLNKCMFYSDMLNYRRCGRSISGARYRAIQHGPVPEHYDTIYDNVDGVYKTVDIIHENEVEKLHADDAECASLSKEEMEVLKEVLAKFGRMTSAEVVQLSHTEGVWQKHQADHELIPYSEAFELEAFG